MAGPAFGPMPNPIDLLVHGCRERNRFAQSLQNVGRRQVPPFRESIIERADDGLFNFGAAEIRTGRG